MNSTLFGKAWAVMILLLVITQALFLGFNLAEKDWQQATTDGILLAFWVFAAVWFHLMAIRDAREEVEHEHIKQRVDGAMKQLFGEIKRLHTTPDEKPVTDETIVSKKGN